MRRFQSYEQLNDEDLPKTSCTCSAKTHDLIVASFFTACCAGLFIALIVVFYPSSTASTPKRVLIFGLDGLKASVLREAMFNRRVAPNLRHLYSSGVGAVCDGCARTHDGNRYGSAPPTDSKNYSSPYQWVTGPGWCSVLTGVSNAKHKVRGNEVSELMPFAGTSKVFPTIFALAKSAGLRTAASGDYGFLSSPEPSDGDCRPGVVDFECGEHAYLDCESQSSCNLDFRQALPETDDQDNRTAAFIQERISHADADLLFAHFVRIDVVGHKHGWGSAEQMRAVAFVDSLVGSILELLRKRSEPWLILATSDHGGLGRQHGANWNDDENIPLIIGTAHWEGKLRNISLPASHCDVAPTVLRWFGIPSSGASLDGVSQGI